MDPSLRESPFSPKTLEGEKKLNEIHLYIVPVREELSKNKLDKALDLLDEGELEVYHRYQVNFKKVEFLIGRVVLKTQLSHLLGCDPRNIHFNKNRFGKLFLPDLYYRNDNKKLYFNLSHTRNVIVCAITLLGDIGIDVEHTVRDYLDVMSQVFNETEMTYVNTQICEEEKFKSFYMLWTRKEAHIKAMGMGFSLSPLSFTVPMQFGKASQEDWEYYSFHPFEDYIVSTAIKNLSGFPIQYHIHYLEG